MRASQLVRQGNLIGGNITKTRIIGTGRLRGFTSVDSNTVGGTKAAEGVFRSLTGRSPSGQLDRFVADDGLEVVFRSAGRSGHPKVEIINHSTRMHEKVTFLQ